MLNRLLRSSLASAFVLIATTAFPSIANANNTCDSADYCSTNAPNHSGFCDDCLTGTYAGWGFMAFTGNNGGASCVPCSNSNQVPAGQQAACNACDAAGGSYAIDTDECFVGGISTALSCQPAPICEIPDYCSANYPGAEGPCMDCLEGDYLLPWGFGAFSTAAGGASCMPCSNHNIPASQTATCDDCLNSGGTYSVDTDECFYAGVLNDPACEPLECNTHEYCEMHMPKYVDFCNECLTGGFGWQALTDAGGGPSCVPCGSHWLTNAEQHACDMCSSDGGLYSALTNECFYESVSSGPC